MKLLINTMWFFIGFVGMELFSWAFHKYLMHGILWSIHKTHHEPQKGFFELNDVFSLLFATVGIALIFAGVATLNAYFWVGIGISCYGMLYFILHDSLVHQRFKTFARPKNKYMRAIFEAHKAHHRTRGRDGAESFGLLFVHKKFFKS